MDEDGDDDDDHATDQRLGAGKEPKEGERVSE